MDRIVDIATDGRHLSTYRGFLMVEEAGGKVTDFKGDYYSPYQPHIAATNGKIHDELLLWVNDQKKLS